MNMNNDNPFLNIYTTENDENLIEDIIYFFSCKGYCVCGRYYDFNTTRIEFKKGAFNG